MLEVMQAMVSESLSRLLKASTSLAKLQTRFTRMAYPLINVQESKIEDESVKGSKDLTPDAPCHARI